MVNTRRKESLSVSTRDNESPRYRTRRNYSNYAEDRTQDDENFYPSDLADSAPDREAAADEEEEEEEEDSVAEEFKLKDLVLKNPSRVRELRSRFVCNRQFSSSSSYNRRHDERAARTNNRKSISLNKRASLTVFRSSRKILNDDESDAYSASMRNHRPRHDRHKQHRSALSLRPITRKSYNDSHFMSETDNEDDVVVRRSSRNTRNRRNYNMSWLVDEQMHKVGYPNLRADYYDDDSSDAEIESNARGRKAPESTPYPYRAVKHNYRRPPPPHDAGDDNDDEDIDIDGNVDRDDVDDNNDASDDKPPIINGDARTPQQKQHRPLRMRTSSSALHHDKENSDAVLNAAGAADKGVASCALGDRRDGGKMTRQKSRSLGGSVVVVGEPVVGDMGVEEEDGDGKGEDTVGEGHARTGRKTRGAAVPRTHNNTEDADRRNDNSASADGVADSSSRQPKDSEQQSKPSQQRSKENDSKDPHLDYNMHSAGRNLRRRAILDSGPQNRRGRKSSGSSTSSEVSRKGYSLRNRPKKINFKMSPMIITSTRHSQRRFNLRRRKPLPQNLSSSSSSDSDDKYRTPNKYNNAKSPYSKSEHKSSAGGSKIIPIRPEQMDGSVRFTSVGGLDGHVQCLKEMVLLPMMYPEVFNRFQITPPRGVLFHGPPGTGKTLIARALANECSFGSRKLSFFMRKGADLLCKWVGESEKQLRLLFDQACEMKPSIIFFDELDGLAPVRSARNDQFHASIVSTLLALMDGLNNRGEVIVIGATNRIDAIDPALRRPGRFDRELYFPLPARKEREEILKVHVSKWDSPPSGQLIAYLAEGAVGYCGSDLRALCSEAVIQSFRRVYPQVYAADHILLLNPENVQVERIDFLRAKSMLVPASHRVSQNLGRKLLPVLSPLLQGPMTDVIKMLEKSFPHGTNPALAKVKLSAGFKPAQLLLAGEGPCHGQTSHLAPALLQHMEHIHTHLLDMTTLHRQSGITPEEACIQVFHEAKRNVPSIIYIPCLNEFWALASKTIQSILIAQIVGMHPNLPVLIMATSDVPYSDLGSQLQYLFSRYRHEIYHLANPATELRAAFFRPLVVDGALRAPRPSRRLRMRTPPPLPRAPTPPPPPLSPGAAQRIFEAEERTLSELRIFLREMCKKLANNRLFFIFTKPVDTEEVPDYPTIIKQPMDLETMMTKVDLHSYQCAKDFLADIDLICQNALEYNPAKTSADKQIRHRACSLRDYAFTLIKNEMDSDFEDKCQEIARKRKERKASVAQYLSPYLHTDKTPTTTTLHTLTTADARTPAPNTTTTAAPTSSLPRAVGGSSTTTTTANSHHSHTHHTGANAAARTNSNRKRRIPSWQRGYVTSAKKRRQERAKRAAVEIVAEDIGQSDDKEQSTDADDTKDNTDDTPLSMLHNSNIIAAADKLSDGVQSNGSVNGGLKLPIRLSQMLEVRVDVNMLDLSASVSGSVSDRSKMEINTSMGSPSCKRRLSELLSPSELLNDHLEFDDIDQTLNEAAISSSQQDDVHLSRAALEETLIKIVAATEDMPLQVLLDLYYQLSRIVKMYAATHDRKQLPVDLLEELRRFSSVPQNWKELSFDSIYDI